jgi:hypothetical protein
VEPQWTHQAGACVVVLTVGCESGWRGSTEPKYEASSSYKENELGKTKKKKKILVFVVKVVRLRLAVCSCALCGWHVVRCVGELLRDVAFEVVWMCARRVETSSGRVQSSESE